eukprot:m.126854 g.126854  ORF g.126854 m.126854 type:complete len:55 (+) comp9438_c3_seq1:1469-1633(+)
MNMTCTILTPFQLKYPASLQFNFEWSRAERHLSPSLCVPLFLSDLSLRAVLPLY